MLQAYLVFIFFISTFSLTLANYNSVNTNIRITHKIYIEAPFFIFLFSVFNYIEKRIKMACRKLGDTDVIKKVGRRTYKYNKVIINK